MSDALKIFDNATADWFRDAIGAPTAVQELGWPAIASGGHALLSAPTGTGKTLAAFLVFVDRLKAEAAAGTLQKGVQLIYVSPLKALAGDIRENLRRPLQGIGGAELTTALRTGDTTAAERRKMIKSPPHILITTPESLYLLLTSMSGQDMLKTARAVIIDELHALINGKRGAHLMLSLARLDRLCGRPLQRVGLSATIEPLPDAARYLAHPDPVAIVAPPMQKLVNIEVNSPIGDMRVLPEGTIWPELARTVYAHCAGARTVIAFVENRAQAEKLAYHVNDAAGHAFARTHHGCVSREQRQEAERQLRSGELRLLIATSSMELGIDVGEIDLVLQIGFPRTIAGAMQRLGRAGHNPGRTSVMHMFPRTAAEGVYCGLTATVALAGGIERVQPPRGCLDVLAQHLVSMATGDGYTVDDVLMLLERAWSFGNVKREDVRAVLRMLAGDFEHERDRPARPRILYDRIHDTVLGDAYSRMLAVSAGGTIPDRGWFSVRMPDGTRLGELDEEFVFEARVGDKFLLGAFAWRITALERDSVMVEPASVEGAQSPFWRGDAAGRPYQTGLAFGALFRSLTREHEAGRLHEGLRALHLDESAARNAEGFVARQIEAIGCLPDDRTIILEHFSDDAGEHQIMVHSVFGRRVNAGLSLLMREAARGQGCDVSCFDDDDGFLVYPLEGGSVLPDGLLHRINPETARTVLEALLPATPLFGMAFRYSAGRALMMGMSHGKRQPLWVQRMRGAEALSDAVERADHPLIRETRRECLEDLWDLAALEEVLRGIRSGAIAVHELHADNPSPMALPLRRQAEANLTYEYHPTTDRTRRSVDKNLAAAMLKEQDKLIKPAPEQLERVAARSRQPTDEHQLHSLLMAEGDLAAGEVDAPVDWLTRLARAGRALYIEPGLWICAEQAEQYQDALEQDDGGALRRIARRCLRYRGPHSVETLSERYVLPEQRCADILNALVQAGEAVHGDGLYYHAELYDRARRETISARRRQVRTLPPEAYAALMCRSLRTSGSKADQLRAAIESLLDRPFPPQLWEGALLPARVGGYQPAMLDALLAQGGIYWEITPSERPMLSFRRVEDIDWDADPPAFAADMSADEKAVAAALARRGASFEQSLSESIGGRSPLDTLMALAERGLVHADSFMPVRQWLEADKVARYPAKRRARARSQVALSGRWELIRPHKPLTDEQLIDRAFDRSTLLCRETADGIKWGAALELLRVWEYTGRVRRGYFIKGLSGAQFMRDGDCAAALLYMERPPDDIVWLNAVDPAQLWGGALRHAGGAAFMCVPGTAVALRAGLPVALLERQGAQLRVLDGGALPDALAAFARDFEQRRIFSQQKRVIVKQYPPGTGEMLAAAGFSRQMDEFVLWRNSAI